MANLPHAQWGMPHSLANGVIRAVSLDLTEVFFWVDAAKTQPAQAQAYINLAERARGAAAAMSFLAKRG